MKISVLRLSAAVALGAVPALGQSTVVLNPVPTRVVGQPSARITTLAPNLVEGRELFGPRSIAVDTSTFPYILYVCDTLNNRVLGWKDYRAANGSPADVVVGQRDKISTGALGPGTGTSAGLNAPGGIAVDRNGNLYVADTGNNRILRYPRPIQQTGELIAPDQIFGQANLNISLPNQGNLNLEPSARTIMTNVPGVGALEAALFMDGNGNLWLTDAGNNRILRYPASELRTGNNAPAADLVLGQPNFTSLALPDFSKLTPEERALIRLRKDFLLQPSVVNVDSAGRVFVSDDLRRVLMVESPLTNGKTPSRVIGVRVNALGIPQEPNAPDQFSIGVGLRGDVTGLSSVRSPAGGLFSINNYLYVVDTAGSRIIRYDPPDKWDPETATAPCPSAKFVFGQPDLISGFPNGRNKLPSDSTYANPSGALYVDNMVFLADTGNNRALIIPVSGELLQPARNVQGQFAFTLNAPNLIEGRELFLYNGLPVFSEQGPFGALRLGGPATFTGGVIVDNKSTPPHLYIADSLNNRILCYDDVRRVRPGDKADLIIGQETEFESKVNAPNNDENAPTQTGVFRPTGLALDSFGNLYVADSGNGRVLRFPAPFSQGGKKFQPANLILGQTGFTFKTTDITRNTMRLPIGLAFTVQGDLAVSDAFHHRVLLFRKDPTPGSDFTTGMPATIVFGRPAFDDRAFDDDANRLDTPHHIAIDSSNRLYVCDTVKNRIVVYSTNVGAGQFPLPNLSITTGTAATDRLRGPQGIAIFEGPDSSEIWVADTQSNRMLRYPRYDELLINPFANSSVPAAAPLAVAFDSIGNMYMADRSHRVGFYFPLLQIFSSANTLVRPVSPGTLASLYAQSSRNLAAEEGVAGPTPWPKDLADTVVLWDNLPTALHYAGPRQVNFIVPMAALTSGTADIEVMRKSSGQTVASATVQLGTATPGFFTKGPSQGQGQSLQIAALNNDDNTENSAANPVGRTKVIAMFATGLGFVPGAPPDGVGASGPVALQSLPRVLVGTGFVDDSDILYAGLAPGLPGVWQLNVRISERVAPSAAVPVALVVNDIPSTQDLGGRRISTTIAVKQ